MPRFQLPPTQLPSETLTTLPCRVQGDQESGQNRGCLGWLLDGLVSWVVSGGEVSWGVPLGYPGGSQGSLDVLLGGKKIRSGAIYCSRELATPNYSGRAIRLSSLTKSQQSGLPLTVASPEIALLIQYMLDL